MIRERPAYERLCERVREIDQLRRDFGMVFQVAALDGVLNAAVDAPR
jgi:hypothetical protein